MHFGPEEAVGVVVNADGACQSCGQIRAQMTTVNGGQVRRHYAPIKAIDDAGKPDADGAFRTEAGVRRPDPRQDQLQQPLVIIAWGAHALFVTEVQATVIHREGNLGATNIKSVIHATLPCR